MQLISLGFAAFWLAALIFYYALPKLQWQTLLAASLLFYFLYAGRIPLFLIVCSGIVWGFGYLRQKGKWMLRAVIFVCITLLLVYRLHDNLFTSNTTMIVPVGVSFFLLALIGYCMDVYWERYAPEKNYFKLLLFLSFFPSLIQGPINRYNKFRVELFKVHTFSWAQICNGIQRFIWGLFKKLILVDRLALITQDIFGNLEINNGFVILMGGICYAIQLYADFTSYMDMILGIGETFGILLPENFKRPYFSRSVGEFWRRWHITLGTWFKDYVMYGFIMSPSGRKIGKVIKKKNKRWGKLVPSLIGTMLVWGLTGLWHEASGAYILWGMYYGIIMCISLCMEEFWEKRKQGIPFFETRLYHIFCIARTCFLVLAADLLICAGSWRNIRLCIGKIMMNGELFGFRAGLAYIMGIPIENRILILFGCCIFLIVSLIQEKHGSVRMLLSRQPLVVRWLVWYIIVFSILMFGTYGAGYDASTFMYQSF